MESFYLTDDIYLFANVPGMPRFEFTFDQFKKMGLDEKISYIKGKEGYPVTMRNTEGGGIFYTMGIGNAIFSHYCREFEKFKNPSIAKANTAIIYSMLMKRLTESITFLGEARKVIKYHKAENPRQW